MPKTFWLLARPLGLILFLIMPCSAGSAMADAYMPAGRSTDSTAQALSDLRAAERRRIPLEVLLKAARHYKAGKPVEVAIIITNLFDAPLLMNSRMLVNHPRLKGEVSFHILGPDGEKVEIQRLITPLSIRDTDYITLSRGESMQRGIDLADLYGMKHKGIYKVMVSYHNEVDYIFETNHAWKGMVTSEPVEIQLD